MGKGHTRWVAVAVLALASLTSAMGRAQDSSDESSAIREAQQRFTLAEEHFERGEHALALAEFERVLALMEAEGHPNAPLVLYNIGVVNQRMDREQAALDAYERFLSEAPRDAEHYADAQRTALELRQRLALREADASGGGRDDDGSAAAGGLTVSPVGIAIAAVGGAVMIAGAIVGGVALADGDAARAGCVDERCPPSAEEPIASAQTLANASDGLLFGGLAVLATGVVLTFVLGDGGETAASAMCTDQGCAAAVRGAF